MTSLKIYYGPYEAHGVIQFRIQRLYGLLRYLKQHNYELEVYKVNLFNRLAVEMYDRQIFIADIRNFKFNIDCEDDVVCTRAIEAIKEAEMRILKEQCADKQRQIGRGEPGVVRNVSFVEPSEEGLKAEKSVD